jgi:hypothetical protein
VDLVFFSDIDNNFKNQILKEGIVLYEKEWSFIKNSKFWEGFK